jgi:hypothetical protein
MSRKINEIVKEVYKDWKNPFYGAVPYMEAMLSLEKITDKYGYDSGESIVLYFLSNVQTWRGETARRIKKELFQLVEDAKTKRRLKEAKKYSGGMKW